MRIESAMTREVIWIEPSDDLMVAHALMTGLNIRHLPVMEKGRLAGILSDRDVRAFSTVREGLLVVPDLAVSEAMTRNVITCPLTASISDVGTKMLHNKIDCVPILHEDGTLAGLVTSSDLIQLLIDREESAAKRIPFEFKLLEGSKVQVRSA
jgi:acetoin utilization protein AcuB